MQQNFLELDPLLILEPDLKPARLSKKSLLHHRTLRSNSFSTPSTDARGKAELAKQRELKTEWLVSPRTRFRARQPLRPRPRARPVYDTCSH